MVRSDSCLDVVAAPWQIMELIAQLGLLMLGCLLHGGAVVIHCTFTLKNGVLHIADAVEGVSTVAGSVTSLVVTEAVLLNDTVHHGSQSLIRSAVRFLETFLAEGEHAAASFILVGSTHPSSADF